MGVVILSGDYLVSCYAGKQTRTTVTPSRIVHRPSILASLADEVDRRGSHRNQAEFVSRFVSADERKSPGELHGVGNAIEV
jgi:hypothetical protein